MKIADVGGTKLLKLPGLEFNGNKLFAKCELSNPSGSHKDRTYLHILNTLENEGRIHPGMTLVDCSTGNGGAALAWIAREKGYKVVIFMPAGMTQERIEQIKSFSAKIIETPASDFLNGSVEAAEKYSEGKKDVYFINQSSNTLNMEAFYSCGREIVNDLTIMSVVPDYFVCSIGTGGTFSGIASVLKDVYPNIETVGVEVDKSSPVYAIRHHLNFKHHSHNLMGLGAGVLSANTKLSVIDDIRLVNGDAAWKRMKSFINSEGLGIGPTCAANLIVSEEIMKNISNKVIVTLFFDSAWKYKSRWAGVYPEYSCQEGRKC
ncbi:pyridoxal-phosphate dependent enzyme [Erwinia sp. E602]|uniref:cysteine synthase family protein n=1 Tax=Erwinia sp. E602 TaxID=2675378 RepID=UPI001BA70E9C|nr:cysteine synthase family protein [Erwinia sp. E602]QUG76765.1 pyridoxal-phosphate dependent enzyme [Erwinia sp. E602]